MVDIGDLDHMRNNLRQVISITIVKDVRKLETRCANKENIKTRTIQTKYLECLIQFIEAQFINQLH